MGAVPAGMIGWVFGLIPSMAKNRSFSAPTRALWISEANASAVNLAKFSGAYGLSHCIITRIRQVDDALNRGVAGEISGHVPGIAVSNYEVHEKGSQGHVHALGVALDYTMTRSSSYL